MAKPKKPKVPMTSENFVLEKFLFSLLRKAFKTTPMYHEALNKSKEEFFIPSKTGKPMRRIRFKCAECGKTFLPPESKKKRAAKEGVDESEVKRAVKDVAVDHVQDVINPLTGFQGWIIYIARLFCGADGLQVLCNFSGERDGVKSCHAIKTLASNSIRRQVSKETKPKKGKKA